MTAILLTCCSSDCEVKAETNQYQANMAKTLIVYYCYTGNCKAIVNSLASQITADQLEIQPPQRKDLGMRRTTMPWVRNC